MAQRNYDLKESFVAGTSVRKYNRCLGLQAFLRRDPRWLIGTWSSFVNLWLYSIVLTFAINNMLQKSKLCLLRISANQSHNRLKMLSRHSVVRPCVPTVSRPIQSLHRYQPVYTSYIRSQDITLEWARHWKNVFSICFRKTCHILIPW